jgi:hypothetical protein
LVSAWLTAFAEPPEPVELLELAEALRALRAELPKRARCAGIIDPGSVGRVGSW